ncbi:serine hydrolase FSH [Xylariaceae sp. FL0255]|nr:serine hydrolase FSH [Xylariaceae sp. FL0255]
MKILCLHGRGQNALSFKADLEPIITEAQIQSPDLSFVFADELTFGTSHTADSFDSQHGSPNTSDIRQAHEWLGKKIEVDGPFDGVIAFCHGAAIVSSYLVHQQWYRPEQGTPFHFAVFFSGSIPLETLKDLGVPVEAAERIIAETKEQRQRGLGPLPSHVSKMRRALFNSDDCFGLNLNKVPRELRLRIPTVHVWGEDDPDFPSAVQLVGLCEPYIQKIHTHARAHCMPSGLEETGELSRSLLWVASRARWPGRAQMSQE